ncbi:MAG: hypothetical protein IPP62_12965 [bacterium]|nr:hypothetical protein [bacterium]
MLHAQHAVEPRHVAAAQQVGAQVGGHEPQQVALQRREVGQGLVGAGRFHQLEAPQVPWLQAAARRHDLRFAPHGAEPQRQHAVQLHARRVVGQGGHRHLVEAVGLEEFAEASHDAVVDGQAARERARTAGGFEHGGGGKRWPGNRAFDGHHGGSPFDAR